MLNKLYSLQRYLNRLSLTKEAIFLDALIKQAYQDSPPFIEYDNSNSSAVKATLKVNKNGREEALAYAFASKLEQEVEAHKELLDSLEFKPTGWWQIHVPGFVDNEKKNQYGRRGYGQQLYLVLIEHITKDGGVIISAPISGSGVSQDALGVRNALKRISEVSWIDVALTSSSERINIESLESLSEDDKDRLLSDNRGAHSYLPDYDNIDASQYAKSYRTDEEVKDLKSKERAFLDKKRKELLDELKEENKDHQDIGTVEFGWFIEAEADRRLKDFRSKLPAQNIDLSQGTIFWASGKLPISVYTRSATQVLEEESWEDNRKLESKQAEPNSSEDLDPPIVPPKGQPPYP